MKLFSSEHDSAVPPTSLGVHLFLILSVVSGLQPRAAGRIDGEEKRRKGTMREEEEE